MSRKPWAWEPMCTCPNHEPSQQHLEDCPWWQPSIEDLLGKYEKMAQTGAEANRRLKELEEGPRRA